MRSEYSKKADLGSWNCICTDCSERDLSRALNYASGPLLKGLTTLSDLLCIQTT